MKNIQLAPPDKELKDEFMRFFEERSWNNDYYAKALFYTLTGAVLRKMDRGVNLGGQAKDSRVNILLIQNAGSGKTAGANAIVELSKEVNKVLDEEYPDIKMRLDVVLRTKITSDAALTGTYNPKGKWVVGDLWKYNVLIVTEASNLFNRKQNSEDKAIVNTLLQAMDATGVITKKRAAYEDKEYRTDTSVLLTTRGVREMMDPEIMLVSGLVPRMIFLRKQLTVEEMQENIKKSISLLGKPPSTEARRVAELFAKFILFVQEHHVDEQLSPEIRARIGKCAEEFEALSKESKREMKDRYTEILSRQSKRVAIIALHNAYLRQDPQHLEITQEDLNKGCKFIKGSLRHILVWLDENPGLYWQPSWRKQHILKTDKAILSAIKERQQEDGWASPREVVEAVTKKLSLSEATVYNRLRALQKTGKIEGNGEKAGSFKRRIRMKNMNP